MKRSVKKIKKKMMLIVIGAMVVLCVAGCSSKNKTDNGSEDGKTDSNVAIPNPIVSVESDEAFDDLGIHIDSSKFMTDVSLDVIGDTIAQVNFSVEDRNGDISECTFRGTRDEKLMEDPVTLIAGVYNEMGEETEVKVPVADGELSVYVVSSKDGENVTVAYFEYEGTEYTLYAKGALSQMTLAHLYDCSLEAAGAQ